MSTAGPSDGEKTSAFGSGPVILTIFRDGKEIETRELTTGTYTIGRLQVCEISLDDDAVSRMHANLFVEFDGVRVEDLGSANGIIVEGQRVPAAHLQPEQRLGLPPFELVVTPAISPDDSASANTDSAQDEATRILRPPRVQMNLVKGSAPQESYTLEFGRTRVGRAEECEIRLPEQFVSRFHAEFELGYNYLTLRDLGSTVGTFMGGRRIKEAQLRQGDRVLVGNMVLEVGHNEGVELPPPGTRPDLVAEEFLETKTGDEALAFSDSKVVSDGEVFTNSQGYPNNGDGERQRTGDALVTRADRPSAEATAQSDATAQTNAPDLDQLTASFRDGDSDRAKTDSLPQMVAADSINTEIVQNPLTAEQEPTAALSLQDAALQVPELGDMAKEASPQTGEMTNLLGSEPLYYPMEQSERALIAPPHEIKTDISTVKPATTNTDPMGQAMPSPAPKERGLLIGLAIAAVVFVLAAAAVGYFLYGDTLLGRDDQVAANTVDDNTGDTSTGDDDTDDSADDSLGDDDTDDATGDDTDDSTGDDTDDSTGDDDTDDSTGDDDTDDSTGDDDTDDSTGDDDTDDSTGDDDSDDSTGDDTNDSTGDDTAHNSKNTAAGNNTRRNAGVKVKSQGTRVKPQKNAPRQVKPTNTTKNQPAKNQLAKNQPAKNQPSGGTKTDNAADLLQQAQTMMDQGDNVEAVTLLTKATKNKTTAERARSMIAENKRICAERAKPHLERGEGQLKNVEYEAALESYLQAMQIDPWNKTAKAGLKKLRSQMAQQVEQLFDDGLIALKLGQQAEACSKWKKAKAISSPGNPFFQDLKTNLKKHCQ